LVERTVECNCHSSLARLRRRGEAFTLFVFDLDLFKSVNDSPERLEVEITESVLLHKNADNLQTLHELKHRGVSIVLDDFGTGYSSLSYLRTFPFDKIKIDKSFVGEMPERAECVAIVDAVTALGRGLNILTTAEGVETEKQLSLLRAAGVDQVQGFLFSHPCSALEIEFDRTAVPAKSGKAA
jgi:EAL domain-containing protein (putative c-di-GMP-specific phosphodiesterase class I)